MDVHILLGQILKYQIDEQILILVDMPEGVDNPDWEWRREYAYQLCQQMQDIGVPCVVGVFKATGNNNADLPEKLEINDEAALLQDSLKSANIVIALTEYSATAPLKVYAMKFGIRAISMPGFSESMLAATEIDFNKLRYNVGQMHERLSNAEAAHIVFSHSNQNITLFLDLKGSKALKDDGDCSQAEKVINLPSGEAFIVPNETPGSRSKGYLPLKHKDYVAVYRVESNRIVGCDKSTELIEKIMSDPAVGNIAELGIGMLSGFGIYPCGRVLLDEKLGMHIALGRSDHMGGMTSPDKFTDKANVVHQDYVFIDEDIQIKELRLVYADGEEIVIKDNNLEFLE